MRLELRTLGRTGLAISALGCGAVGGLMVRGAPADQLRAVGRAVALGVNYFDTAPLYGDGASEINLGRVLRELGANVLVGTKVRVTPGDYGRLAEAIPAALEASLRRLGRDHVDLFQLHDPIEPESSETGLGVSAVLEEVARAFQRLREQGKTRFVGVIAAGDTGSLLRVVGSGAFDTAQVPYNMLNPSAQVTECATGASCCASARRHPPARATPASARRRFWPHSCLRDDLGRAGAVSGQQHDASA